MNTPTLAPERIASNNDALRRHDIAALAYQLWTERGCPIGSPEEDWFQAEAELMSETRASDFNRVTEFPKRSV